MIDLLFWRSYINDSAIFLGFFLVLGWLVLVLFSFDVRFFILVFESFYIGGKFLFFFLFFPFSFLSFFFFFVASSSFLLYFMKKVPLKFHISCKTRFCVGHINGSDSFDMLEGLFTSYPYPNLWTKDWDQFVKRTFF